MNPTSRNLLNFAAFQIAWFACVLGGAYDRVAAGTLAVAAVVVLHLAIAPRPGPEARLVAIVTGIGLVWDSLIVSLGLMSYPTGMLAPGVAPIWILAMWALFATTLNLSMGWLKGRPWLAATFGAIGGPLAYVAGKKLGAVEMNEPWLALLGQGVGWAVMMPVLLRLAAKLNGFDTPHAPARRAGPPIATTSEVPTRSLPVRRARPESRSPDPMSAQRLIAASVLGGLLFTTLDASSEVSRRLSFDVYLDERPIGFQYFDLQPTGDGLRVVTQAEFEVTVLRITAFEYDHRNEEFWSGRCLQTIESTTNSNGTPYRVSGRAGETGFVLGGSGLGRLLGGCVGTFAYWDRNQLAGRDRLLNSQTGEYVPVDVRPLGAGSLTLGGREVRVERVALDGRDIDITLAYSADSGEWLALDSRLKSGRMLRYRRVDFAVVAATTGSV